MVVVVRRRPHFSLEWWWTRVAELGYPHPIDQIISFFFFLREKDRIERLWFLRCFFLQKKKNRKSGSLPFFFGCFNSVVRRSLFILFYFLVARLRTKKKCRCVRCGKQRHCVYWEMARGEKRRRRRIAHASFCCRYAPLSTYIKCVRYVLVLVGI